MSFRTNEIRQCFIEDLRIFDPAFFECTYPKTEIWSYIKLDNENRSVDVCHDIASDYVCVYRDFNLLFSFHHPNDLFYKDINNKRIKSDFSIYVQERTVVYDV